MHLCMHGRSNRALCLKAIGRNDLAVATQYCNAFPFAIGDNAVLQRNASAQIKQEQEIHTSVYV